MRNDLRIVFLATAALLAAAPLSAQTPDSILAVSYQGQSRFRVNIDGGILATGTYDGDISGSGVPAEGSGTRMMWYPRKAAFRAGYINGTQWDAANIGIYSVALGENVRASGDNGVALGVRSTAAGFSTFAAGEDNTATGAASVALGKNAHTNARQGSFVFSDRSVPTDTAWASSNHSATFRVRCGLRIVMTTNGTRLATTSGDWGGTGVAFGGPAAEGSTTCVGGNYLGQANAMISTSTGAYLHTNGTWTNASDRNRKHLFAAVSGEDVLARLRALPIQTWTYKTESDSVRHLGPMAQDFRATFGLGDDDKVIGTVDADGVALAAAQALEARTRTQREEIAALRAENRALAERLARLEALVQAQAGAPKP